MLAAARGTSGATRATMTCEDAKANPVVLCRRLPPWAERDNGTKTGAGVAGAGLELMKDTATRKSGAVDDLAQEHEYQHHQRDAGQGQQRRDCNQRRTDVGVGMPQVRHR